MRTLRSELEEKLTPDDPEDGGLLCGYEVHPAANIFPLMGDEEIQSLAKDIKKKGLGVPVTVYTENGRKTLLDGRHRVLACREAGVQVEEVEYLGDDPVGHSLALNLERRHLSISEKSAVALKLEDVFSEEARKRLVAAGEKYGVSHPKKPEADLPQAFERGPQARDMAAKALGISGRTVQKAKRVKNEDPDLFKKVESGEMSITAAEEEVKKRHIMKQAEEVDSDGLTEKQTQMRMNSKERIEVFIGGSVEGVIASFEHFMQNRGNHQSDLSMAVQVASQEDLRQWVAILSRLASKTNSLKRGISHYIKEGS